MQVIFETSDRSHHNYTTAICQALVMAPSSFRHDKEVWICGCSKKLYLRRSEYFLAVLPLTHAYALVTPLSTSRVINLDFSPVPSHFIGSVYPRQGCDSTAVLAA